MSKRFERKANSPRLTLALASALLAVAAGCTVGPNYHRPAATAPMAAVPSAWKGTPPWQPASPKDTLPRGEWWKLFGDSELDTLERQMLEANQTLAAATSRLEQARSLARVSTSALFPQLSVDPNAGRQRGSGNRPLNGSATTATPYTQNVYAVPFALSYEADVFGRVRRSVEASNASLQNTAANLENQRLVLSAELAADYFTLRELDAEFKVVEESVGYERRGLELVQRRHDGGIASGLEVAQQASLLDATLTQLALVRESRAQYEHAVAALIGQPASNFAVASRPLDTTPPPLPLGIPSDVLERRPDVAAAERSMAYWNAQVGLAHAAFYPRFTLGGSGGLQSRDIGTLANAPSFFWSLGADALEPIFTGGRNRANLAAAKAGYEASVADYRQTVLSSFQQVEDGISSLNALSEAAKTQAAAVEEARRELAIANSRYVGGVATYLDVISAQSALLASERLATQLLGQRMVASVYLVKALGGGWDAKALEQQTVHPQAHQLLEQ